MVSTQKFNFSSKQAVVGVIILFLTLILIIVVRPQTTRQTQDQPPSPTTSDLETLEGELVSGFPDVPPYPDTRLIDSYKKVEGEKVGFQATWETQTDTPTVIRWYLNELTNDGWKIVEQPENIQAEGEQYIVAEKDNMQLDLFVVFEDDVTTIDMEFPLR